MLKKIIINLFNLNDLRDVLLSERRKQKLEDEQAFSFRLNKERRSNEQALSLMQQSHEVEVTMLKEQLKDFEMREKKISNQEYQNKINHRKNLTDAAIISSKLSNIGQVFIKESAEIQRIVDDADVKKLLEG